MPAYSSCSSYSDSGLLFDWYDGQDHPAKPSLSFETFFVRPGRVRFEWTDLDQTGPPESKYKFWSNGKLAFSDYPFNSGIESLQGIRSAVGAATGISKGVVRILLMMLVEPDYKRVYTELLKRTTLISDEVVCDQDCFRLEGSLLDNNVRMSFSKTDLALRRYVTDRAGRLAPRRFTDIIFNATGFDEPIPASIFDSH